MPFYIKFMMYVQSSMDYFIHYAHFQGNNPPWPADFGSTPCNVSNWNIDLAIPNTIDSYCTTLYITTLFNSVCVIAQWRNVLPAHLSCVSVWCMNSTSKKHVVVNGGCCVAWNVVQPQEPLQGWVLWRINELIPCFRQQQVYCHIDGSCVNNGPTRSNRSIT